MPAGLSPRAARETHDFEHDTHVRPGGARHPGDRPVHSEPRRRPCSTSTPCAARKGSSPPRGRWSAGPGSTPAARRTTSSSSASRRARRTSTGARSTSRCRRRTSRRCAPTSWRTSGQRELFVQDLHAGADPTYRLPVRMISEYAWHSLFVRNLFIVPTAAERAAHQRRSSPCCARRRSRPTRPATAPAPTSSSP